MSSALVSFLNIPYPNFFVMAAIAAMKALIVRDGKFLALELEIGRKKLWDLPGGKVEDGEEPMQTLLREVKEETALDVSVGNPVGIYHFLRKTDGLLAVCTVFKPPMNISVNGRTASAIAQNTRCQRSGSSPGNSLLVAQDARM